MGRLIGALAAILAAGLLPSPTARAGCSARHVLDGPAPAPGALHLELLESVGVIPAGHPGMPPLRSPSCSGALCSGSPATPLSPVPPPPPGAGPWAMGHSPLAPDVPASAALARHEAVGRPVGRPGSVFRPPPRLVVPLP